MSTRVILALMLSCHVLLLARSAMILSPTTDEPAHLVAGLLMHKHGHTGFYKVNPPLVRAVGALPVSLAGYRENLHRLRSGGGHRSEWAVGRDFFTLNGERAFRLITFARWACIPFSLLGCCVCFLWASRIGGKRAGLVAALLWCVSPTVMGHGALLTPDVAAAAMGLLAAYRFRQWSVSRSWSDTYLAGAAFGLALLCKTSWVILFVLLPCISLLDSLFQLRRGFREAFVDVQQTVFLCIVALILLNAGYGFRGTMTNLGEYEFYSASLSGRPHSDRGRYESGNAFAGTIFSDVPVPLPHDFVTGVDLQKRDFELGKPSYLMGRWRPHGSVFYYMLATLLKVPAGTLLLLVAAIWQRSRRATRVDWMLLLLIPLTIYVTVSLQTGINSHFRYVLPALPFFFVFASTAFTMRNRLAGRIFVGTALTWTVISSLATAPESLSYFNEFCGGPQNGHRYLLNSNIDWGQDMLRLREWAVEEGAADTLHVVSYCPVEPEAFGFQSGDAGFRRNSAGPPSDGTDRPQPGLYALSANRLFGHNQDCRSFRRMRPVQRIGYSIHVFYVPFARHAAVDTHFVRPAAKVTAFTMSSRGERR